MSEVERYESLTGIDGALAVEAVCRVGKHCFVIRYSSASKLNTQAMNMPASCLAYDWEVHWESNTAEPKPN